MKNETYLNEMTYARHWAKPAQQAERMQTDLYSMKNLKKIKFKTTHQMFPAAEKHQEPWAEIGNMIVGMMEEWQCDK